MPEFFKMLYDDKGVYGVAKSVRTEKQFSLPHNGRVKNWKPLLFDLVEGEFADYLSNNLACRLCSDGLKERLSECASSVDELQWLPSDVRDCRKEVKRYWVLHFPSSPDVLSREHSIIAGKFVVKPVLSREHVGEHRVFTYRNAGPLRLFVSDVTKQNLEVAGCTGIEFSKLPVK